MTKLGMRHNNPYLNNLGSPLIVIGNLLGGNFGEPYLGCGDQRNVMKGVLDRMRFKDKWIFKKNDILGGAHRNLIGRSSNPKDPVLIVDPWHGEITRINP